MKKHFLISAFITAVLGLGAFCIKDNFVQAKADALPLPYHSFSFSAAGDAVALKRAANDYVNVDTTTYKYFAVNMEISPKVSNQWAVYTLALIDQGNNVVVSFDLTADKLSAAVDYPDGLSAADYTGAGGSPANVRKASGRLNLPTTRQGYFVAQKSSAYYSTIETGFNGTIFYYLPDYTSSTNLNVLGLKVVNRDSVSNGKTTNIFSTYFCEDITKVESAGFASSGNKLDYGLIRCVSLSGGASIKTVTNVSSGKGLSVTASATSETVISFENQVAVSTSTYKYLALDLNITTPTSSGYLNIAPKILDNNRDVTNALALTYAKAQAAKVDEFPEGLNQSDWAGAVGGTRVNLPSEQYTRISYLTNTNNLYVPAKADNAYYLVFKGGARYTTYIYLPDFGVDSFDLNSLSLTANGSCAFTVNQVYLCERVTRIGKSNFTYEPTGSKLVLPIISAYSYTATLAEATVSVPSDIYYYATIDPATVNGSIEYFIYKESSDLIIEVTPTANHRYALSALKVNGSPVSLTDGKYVAQLTSNVTLLAEFEESYSAGDFARDLLKLTKGLCNSSYDGVTNNGAALATIWTTLSGSEYYLALDASIRNTTLVDTAVDSTVVVPATDELIDAMSDADALGAALYRYEYCTSKYSLSAFIVGRTITVSPSINHSPINVNQSTAAIIVAIAISTIGLIILSVCLISKKRRVL